MQYIALLRGINVGGHRPLKMDDLRALFQRHNFEQVKTYIQSGNAVFEGPEMDPGTIAQQISDSIEEQFGYDVPVLVLTAEEMQRAHAGLPFEEEGSWKCYISFLPEYPPKIVKQELEATSSEIDRYQCGEKCIYSLVDKSAKKKSDFSNGFIEKHFNMPATTRNLRTVRKLLTIAGKYG